MVRPGEREEAFVIHDVEGKGMLSGRAASWACTVVTHVLLASTCLIGGTGCPSLWQMTPAVSLVPPGKALSLLPAPRNLEVMRRWPGSCQGQPLLRTKAASD